MARKTRITVLLVLLVLLLVVSFLFLFTQTIIADDFLLYDDMLVEESFTGCPNSLLVREYQSETKECSGNKWDLRMQVGAGNGFARASWGYDNGMLFLRAGKKQGTASIILTAKQDLKDKDVRIVGMTEFKDSGSVDVKIGGVTIYHQPEVRRAQYDVERFVIDIFQGITSEELLVVVNGVEKTIPEPTSGILTFEVHGAELRDFGTQDIMFGVDVIKYRYLFNCEVEADEQPVRDVFLEGSTFDISDLSFFPLKFCLDAYPAVVRSLEEEGVRADIRGEITRKLARGEKITVQSGTTISVHYIADYENGMTERCALGQAYDTKTKKCVQVINEAEDVIRDFITTQVVREGPDSVYFKNSLSIGDLVLQSNKPTFLCANSLEEGVSGNVFAPNPKKSCWQTSINGITLLLGERKSLNEFFDVEFVNTKASWSQDQGVSNDWQNEFVLYIKNKNFMDIKTASTSGQLLKLNQPAKITYELTNSLASFDNSQSGYRAIVTKDLITTQTPVIVNQAFKKGVSTNEVVVDTSQLGGVVYEVIPFMNFGDTMVFDDKKITYAFVVGDADLYNLSCTNIGCPSDSSCNAELGVCERTVTNTITQTVEKVSPVKITPEKKWFITPVGWIIIGVLALLFIIPVLKRKTR